MKTDLNRFLNYFKLDEFEILLSKHGKVEKNLYFGKKITSGERGRRLITEG